MTVEELRELLANVPPTARVTIRLGDDDHYDPSGVVYDLGEVFIDCDDA